MIRERPQRAPGVEDDEAPAGGGRQAYGLGRILALSDCVFAFALTFLAAQLAVPALAAEHSAGQLTAALLGQAPAYLTYGLSFAMIAIFWYSHHQVFGYVQRYDWRLIALNFGFLLFVAVFPFPTAVLARYGGEAPAAVLYAASLSALGLLSATMMWYVTGRLAGRHLETRWVRQQVGRRLATCAVFLMSIPVALWRPPLAEVSWFVCWVGILLLSRDGIRLRRHR